MKTLTWKQLFDFAKNPNVTLTIKGLVLNSVEIFWLPYKKSYGLKPVTDDSYEITII